jgi:hypothetical protein
VAVRRVRRAPRRRTIVLLAVLLVALPASRATGKVLLAKDAALALAFPDAERVEARVFILTDAQKAAVEKLARGPLESQLWTVHVAWRGADVLGYAIIDQHTVRTLPEAFMVVLDPSGNVRRVQILAFYEPPEYMPDDRWIGQFGGRKLDDSLKLGGAIQGITSATLSAVAVTAGVRRALALHEVLIGKPVGER